MPNRVGWSRISCIQLQRYYNHISHIVWTIPNRLGVKAPEATQFWPLSKLWNRWLRMICLFTAGLRWRFSQFWWRWTRRVQRDSHACINTHWTQPIWLSPSSSSDDSEQTSLETSVFLSSSDKARGTTVTLFVKIYKSYTWIITSYLCLFQFSKKKKEHT